MDAGMQVKIRKATTDDIAPLEALISESVRGLSADYYSDDQIESALVNIFGVDTQLIADRTYYVAEADGRAVGCGGWSKRKTLYGGDQAKAGADTLLNPETDAARIRAFFVHPDWARRGIGRQIIEVCERAARRERFKAMELVATMPGEPLYQACGYEVVEKFEIELPQGLKLALARMRKEIAAANDA
jgi:N-acetylglutamate synthase-like GNAT family acetyltransferase